MKGETDVLVRNMLRDRVMRWLAGWCRCICREAPDGTMCQLCGHAHSTPAKHVPIGGSR